MLNHWIGKIFGRAVGCPCHEDLFDFALDGLEEKRQVKIRRHLSDCPHCRDQVKDYAWVSEGIALTAPQLDPPVDMCDKVKARIRGESSAPTPVIQLSRDPLAGWPRFWMRLGPVFAISSIMMTGLAFVAVFKGPHAASGDLQAASQLLNSPAMKLVSLDGEGEAKTSKGCIFMAAGMDQILVKVHGLKACSRTGFYSLWACIQGKKPSRLGTFKAVDGKSTYLLSLPKPLENGLTPLEFEVTQEEPLENTVIEKGPTRLRGRYNL